jgi:hypothetical protein
MIPILPDNMKDYLEAPVPFIMGVSEYEPCGSTVDII